MDNRIVCAAIRHEDGRIVCGARHYDERMIEVLKQFPDFDTPGWKRAAQGFIDRHGDYVTREMAWSIADAAHQIIRDRDWFPGLLHSEHLY